MTNVIFTVLIFAFGIIPRELDRLMSCSSGSINNIVIIINNIEIGSHNVEKVNGFRYLGVT